MPASRRMTLVLALATFTALAQADPILVAEFDFDDELGQADAQGWRAQVARWHGESHYHVEDFSGQGQQTSALSGTKSIWCGLPIEDPRTCHWEAPPGYGLYWSENFHSVAFAVQGDVTLSFLAAVSLEQTFDYVYVQYRGISGSWETLDAYSCDSNPADCLTPQQQYVVPAANHDGSIEFRFFFHSDAGGDAERALPWSIVNYGFVLDDLTVSDGSGVVDFQDFESEAIGEQVTGDGHWFAEPNTDAYYGSFLAYGPDVLQESTQTNDTNFWAFFSGSTRDWDCAGHPEQLVVDETWSTVLSPRIDITQDELGNEIVGDADSLLVEFDVYRDIYPSEQKEYEWRIATYSENCQLDDYAGAGLADGSQKDWYRHQVVVVTDPGTAGIEIELGVRNSNFNLGQCRSHSPLIDNVSVFRYSGTIVAVGDSPGRTKPLLQQNVPNPFNPSTTIPFEVPPGADRVTLAIYDSAGRLVRTLVDESLPPGLQEARWDGRDELGGRVSSGVYYYELNAGAARETRRMVLLK